MQMKLDAWVNQERRLAWLYRIDLLRERDRVNECVRNRVLVVGNKHAGSHRPCRAQARPAGQEIPRRVSRTMSPGWTWYGYAWQIDSTRMSIGKRALANSRSTSARKSSLS